MRKLYISEKTTVVEPVNRELIIFRRTQFQITKTFFFLIIIWSRLLKVKVLLFFFFTSLKKNFQATLIYRGNLMYVTPVTFFSFENTTSFHHSLDFLAFFDGGFPWITFRCSYLNSAMFSAAWLAARILIWKLLTWRIRNI